MSHMGMGILLVTVAQSFYPESTVAHPLQSRKLLYTVCTLQSVLQLLPLPGFIVAMQLPQSALHP